MPYPISETYVARGRSSPVVVDDDIFRLVLTNKREAIRTCRRLTKRRGPGASGEVVTYSGTLLYQCHVTMAGKLVVDEL
jgi:hypothetical protein